MNEADCLRDRHVKGKALYSYRIASPRRKQRRRANRIAVRGVQVRIGKCEIWFLDNGRATWVPKSQIFAQPTLVLKRLESQGFNITDDYVDELMICLGKKNRADRNARHGSYDPCAIQGAGKLN
jgi:hypothetical protein